MHHTDDLYIGPIAVAVNMQARTGIGGAQSSPTVYGIGPLSRELCWNYTPVALAASTVCAAQAIAGAANALINGTLASAGAYASAEMFGRCLNMVSSNAGDTTQTVTLTGTDYLGNAMTEVRTMNGTTTVAFNKAFKTVTRVAVSAVLVGNLSVGTTDKLGLPIYMNDAGFIDRAGWAGVLAQDAGTFTAGDATLPATTSTNDTRGLYQPSSATNGTRILVMSVVLQDFHVGSAAIAYSTAARTGAFGVTPV